MSAFVSFLTSIAKVLFLEGRLGTGLCLHPKLRFLQHFLISYNPNLSRLTTYETNRIFSNNEPKDVVNSNYYDIDQFPTLKFHEKFKSLSLCHIKACSLIKNFDGLEHLIKHTNNLNHYDYKYLQGSISSASDVVMKSFHLEH